MVKLRLTRGGKRFSAFYRLVAVDARQARDGQFIENLGTYDPHKKDLFVKEDRIVDWLAKGAQPTQTFKNLLKSKKLWEKLQATKNTKPKAEKAEQPAKVAKAKPKAEKAAKPATKASAKPKTEKAAKPAAKKTTSTTAKKPAVKKAEKPAKK
ncbi:30S ribosomal protein S16 [Mycoplasmopsis californica]|uniref:Small ribosomal subunit protein bS16 n=1 Tax=Mycoplasmopsis equigenitalium TaxID=114883 RepID=A0ABY5J191_9BACT|nr:30S ribosomal protein S16 [Mycoplasmopsis equigenitalium]UUD37022.1 30S ribosomal protein S16 [Mycoplasmopsis equigenitalium]VEU69679.1 30S ribosomal protein S16 [Mycoplasmopsis californica]